VYSTSTMVETTYRQKAEQTNKPKTGKSKIKPTGLLPMST
jgi:hypothetical protein